MKPVKSPKKTQLVLRRETMIVLTNTTLTKVRGGETVSWVPVEIDGFGPPVAGAC